MSSAEQFVDYSTSVEPGVPLAEVIPLRPNRPEPFDWAQRIAMLNRQRDSGEISLIAYQTAVDEMRLEAGYRLGR